MKIGVYTDPIINKQYSLYSTDAKLLSDDLKDIYSKFYNIPNVEDFKRNSTNSPNSEIMKYENNFISIMTKGGELNGLNDALLIDGYRRLFMSDVPEINVFVKVYNSNEISIQDEIKLMMEFNYWKKFNKNRSSFFERGFSLWVFLKNQVNISTILDELQNYLCYDSFFRDGESKYFDTLFFDNVNLFDDIKFIHELKHRKTPTFNVGKKEYKDLKFPISEFFIEKFGKLRYEHKQYNKIDIEKFYLDILNVDSFKNVVIEYNEAVNYEKKNRFLEKSLDFLMNYIKCEYFGFKKEKTVIEIQEEFKAKLDEIKKKYSPLKSVEKIKYTLYGRDSSNDNQNLLKEINGVDYIIWVKNVDMKQLNTNIEIHKLKFIKTTPPNKFLFKDIDTNIEYEWRVADMRYGNQNFYIFKDKSKIEKKKRPDYVIYSINSNYDKSEYLIKAKTIKRVVELANESDFFTRINYQYITDYCNDLKDNHIAEELTKDITEGIVKWKSL